jgi:hypothetical protein
VNKPKETQKRILADDVAAERSVNRDLTVDSDYWSVSLVML